MGIATWIILCIIHNDVGLRTDKLYTHRILTENLKEIRRVRF